MLLSLRRDGGLVGSYFVQERSARLSKCCGRREGRAAGLGQDGEMFGTVLSVCQSTVTDLRHCLAATPSRRLIDRSPTRHLLIVIIQSDGPSSCYLLSGTLQFLNLWVI